jgi:hypothetical protein
VAHNLKRALVALVQLDQGFIRQAFPGELAN